VAGCRPDPLVAGQFDVDEGADRLGVADGGDAADRVAGVLADEVRCGAAQPRDAEQPGDGDLVDAVRTAGEHQQRLGLVAVAHGEDEAVDDRADRHVEGGRGGRGGADVGGEDADLAGTARVGEEPGHLGHARVHRSGHAVILPPAPDAPTPAGPLDERPGIRSTSGCSNTRSNTCRLPPHPGPSPPGAVRAGPGGAGRGV
jgi:hypothetical protein